MRTGGCSASSTASRRTCRRPMRVHGYFVMPLLAGGEHGRPGRQGTPLYTLIAAKVSTDRQLTDVADAQETPGCSNMGG